MTQANPFQQAFDGDSKNTLIKTVSSFEQLTESKLL